MPQRSHDPGETSIERCVVAGAGLAPEPGHHVVGEALLPFGEGPVLRHLGERE
jgi:hypothetical protein